MSGKPRCVVDRPFLEIDDAYLAKLRTAVYALADPRLRARVGMSNEVYRQRCEHVALLEATAYTQAIADAEATDTFDAAHEDAVYNWFADPDSNLTADDGSHPDERGKVTKKSGPYLDEIRERFSKLVTDDVWAIAKAHNGGRPKPRTTAALDVVTDCLTNLVKFYPQAHIAQALEVPEDRISRWLKRGRKHG